MDLSFPFSADFGRADNREACIDSAQDVYNRLLIGNLPDVDDPNILRFETLISIMRNANNVLDESKMMDLVRIFRPDREGKLELVDFVRSVDRVYKELRLLRASIQSSSHIDAAFESVINVAFFFVAFCILLAAWGIDPLSLFLSFSSIILAFTFAIGMTSSKYFEGLIFILGRKPYDIGMSSQIV
jgi:small-conductance mechanosensitive channel